MAARLLLVHDLLAKPPMETECGVVYFVVVCPEAEPAVFGSVRHNITETAGIALP